MERVNRSYLDVILASIYSLIFSAVLIAILAVIIMFSSIGEKGVIALNIVIKMLSIFIGVFMAFKENKKGMIKGLVVGIIYALFTYLIYSIVNKDFSLSTFTICDIISCFVSGIVAGIFKVNIKKES